MADALTMMGGIGAGSDGLNYRLSDDLVKAWKLDADVIEIVVCRMIIGLEEMRSILNKTPASVR